MDFGSIEEREDRTPERVQLEIEGDWWTSRFYQLLQKSDRAHRERLRLAFPQEVREYEAWLNQSR